MSNMNDVSDSVKDRVITIVDERRGTFEAPSPYLLMPDPSVGPLTITPNANTFNRALRKSITSSRAFDCPELAMLGLMQVVYRVEEGSTVYVVTEATPKDGEWRTTKGRGCTEAGQVNIIQLPDNCGELLRRQLEVSSRCI